MSIHRWRFFREGDTCILHIYYPIQQYFALCILEMRKNLATTSWNVYLQWNTDGDLLHTMMECTSGSNTEAISMLEVSCILTAPGLIAIQEVKLQIGSATRFCFIDLFTGQGKQLDYVAVIKDSPEVISASTILSRKLDFVWSSLLAISCPHGREGKSLQSSSYTCFSGERI